MEELTAAGFAGIQPARSRNASDRVFARARLYDFAARVRMLHRLHLLGGDRMAGLQRYAAQAFETYDLVDILRKVLRGAGMDDHGGLDLLLGRYVRNHRWPAWVSRALKDPMADRVVKAMYEAGGPVPLVELPDRVAGADPDKVRAAADKLIARLVLFEDLDPKTSDIVVDFLPDVREGLDRAGRPRVRPPLVACERPVAVGPDDGPIVEDLRAFLLEVAAEPPRLRQDQGLFQKEFERFQAGLQPLPSWLLELLRWSDETRLDQALALGPGAQAGEGRRRGDAAPAPAHAAGQRWLASGLDAQYAGVYGLVNPIGKLGGLDTYYGGLFADGPDSYYYAGIRDDTRFLGQDVMALRIEKEKKYIPDYWEAKPDDIRALRESLDRSLAALEPGVFYRLESVVAHLAYGEHNPIHLGLAPDRVAVIRDQRSIPPLEELREEAGRSLIESFIRGRLIPLGCVRTAIDAEGKVCIARERRLDAYFGREVPASELAPAADEAAKVVVQPDFSVIVIGLNPTAAAELAPFCERATGGGSRAR